MKNKFPIALFIVSSVLATVTIVALINEYVALYVFFGVLTVLSSYAAGVEVKEWRRELKYRRTNNVVKL